MLIRETDTDFDKHLGMLENSEGEVFFFSANDNPKRFQQKVVDAVVSKTPPEVLLLFHLGVGEKKSRSIGRSTTRHITEALGRKMTVHVFILPTALFNAVEIQVSAGLN